MFMMRARKARNVRVGSGLVKKSARLSEVFTYGTDMRKFSTASRTKKCLCLPPCVYRLISTASCSSMSTASCLHAGFVRGDESQLTKTGLSVVSWLAGGMFGLVR